MNELLVVQRVFRDVFDEDDLVVTMSTTPLDVDGWDSVAQVKIIIALESELGIRLATDEVSAIKSVGDLVSAVQKHLG